jgi:repressor LexA
MNTSEKIKQLRLSKGLSQEALGEIVGVKKAAINKYETGRVVNIKRTTLQKLADVLGVSAAYLLDDKEISDTVSSAVRIPVLGSVPAGIPLEAIEDIVDWEDIPREWTKGGKEFFGLKIQGDSMYPKYMEGDTIILRKADDCENGDECVVYVNGCDVTLKRVIKQTDGIMLQPINPEYEPKKYDYTDEFNPVYIIGVVIELRRKI